MKDFTYKWGEEVRTAILEAFPYVYEGREPNFIEYLVYAFDMIQINDEKEISSLQLFLPGNKSMLLVYQ